MHLLRSIEVVAWYGMRISPLHRLLLHLTTVVLVVCKRLSSWANCWRRLILLCCVSLVQEQLPQPEHHSQRHQLQFRLLLRPQRQLPSGLPEGQHWWRPLWLPVLVEVRWVLLVCVGLLGRWLHVCRL